MKMKKKFLSQKEQDQQVSEKNLLPKILVSLLVYLLVLNKYCLTEQLCIIIKISGIKDNKTENPKSSLVMISNTHDPVVIISYLAHFSHGLSVCTSSFAQFVRVKHDRIYLFL